MRKYRKPHQFKRKKSIFRSRFFWLGILTLFIIGTTFYFLFFSEIFQVEKVIITGEKKVSAAEIKLLIEKKSENKILFFKTKSIFLVNLNGIRKDILNNFPQIAGIEIKRGLPDTLNIVVIERLGLAIWCREEQCFLLDNEGVIFEEALSERDLIKVIDRQNINYFSLGKKVIEKERMSQILEITSKLESDLKIPLKEFMIVSENKLIVTTADKWEIYLNLQSDIEWQLTKLRAVLEEKIFPEERKNLEYIELRFGNFAPYKYRDQSI